MCTNPFFINTFAGCSIFTIEFPSDFLTVDAGSYTLVVKYKGTQYRFEAAFGMGANLVFDCPDIDSNYIHKCFVEDPDGNVFPYSTLTDTFECFSFETVLSQTITEVV